MASTEPLFQPTEGPCARDAAAAEAPAVVGALRNPDACVLLCPDCSCRRLLEERLAKLEGDGSNGL